MRFYTVRISYPLTPKLLRPPPSLVSLVAPWWQMCPRGGGTSYRMQMPFWQLLSPIHIQMLSCNKPNWGAVQYSIVQCVEIRSVVMLCCCVVVRRNYDYMNMSCTHLPSTLTSRVQKYTSKVSIDDEKRRRASRSRGIGNQVRRRTGTVHGLQVLDLLAGGQTFFENTITMTM